MTVTVIDITGCWTLENGNFDVNYVVQLSDGTTENRGETNLPESMMVKVGATWEE